MTRENLATALGLIMFEIDGTGIEQGRTYTDKTSGIQKPLPGRQTAFVWQGSKYPLKCQVDIPEGRPPYAPGSYLASGELFAGGEYDRLSFKGTRNLYLIPVAEAAAALADVAAEEAPTPKAVKAA